MPLVIGAQSAPSEPATARSSSARGPPRYRGGYASHPHVEDLSDGYWARRSRRATGRRCRDPRLGFH
jgi:hypothetical protein